MFFLNSRFLIRNEWKLYDIDLGNHVEVLRNTWKSLFFGYVKKKNSSKLNRINKPLKIKYRTEINNVDTFCVAEPFAKYPLYIHLLFSILYFRGLKHSIPKKLGGWNESYSHAHTPTSYLGWSAEKSQYMPLWGSQMSLSLHDSPICRAQLLQQPQPSRTELTPGAQ